MKTTSKDHEELRFAQRVRHALNEQIAALPDDTTHRLAAIRRVAVAHKKAAAPAFVEAKAPRLVGTYTSESGPHDTFSRAFIWLQRLGMVIPLLILLLGLVGIYYYDQNQRIDDLAELDAAVLTDELPITAYLDRGFNAYLNKRGE